MHNTLKIAVAENHALFRDTLVDLLTESGFTVVFAAPVNTALLLRISSCNLPNLIIISCSTMYPDSIALIKEVKTRFPGMKVLANVVFIHYLPKKGIFQDVVNGVIIKTADDRETIIKAIYKACDRLK